MLQQVRCDAGVGVERRWQLPCAAAGTKLALLPLHTATTAAPSHRLHLLTHFPALPPIPHLAGPYLVKFNTNGSELVEEWRVQLLNTTETDEWK